MQKYEPLPQAPVLSGIKLKEPKKCNCCGASYSLMPNNAPFKMDLFWFDCKCLSTLVVTEDMIDG